MSLHKLGYLAAQRPSMTPLLQGKIKYTFPGLAGQSPPAQYSPFPTLLSPLVFSAPGFRGLPAKSSPILSHKFLPSAWTGPPLLPHQPKYLLFWEVLPDSTGPELAVSFVGTSGTPHSKSKKRKTSIIKWPKAENVFLSSKRQSLSRSVLIFLICQLMLCPV